MAWLPNGSSTALYTPDLRRRERGLSERLIRIILIVIRAVDIQ